MPKASSQSKGPPKFGKQEIGQVNQNSFFSKVFKSIYCEKSMEKWTQYSIGFTNISVRIL